MQTNLSPEIIRLLLVLAATMLAHLFASRALNHAEKLTAKTDNVWDDALLTAARTPLPAFIWLGGLGLILHLIHLQTGEQMLEYLTPVRNIGFIVCIAWFLFRLIREVANNLLTLRAQTSATVDRTTVDVLGKIARITVIVIAALMVMQTLGFSISGVLAFGGVGGIAVGFAAKDLLANLFGGLMVHLDRPFNVGDSIRSPDRQIEGKVEHIGWRQSSIRAVNMSLIYVPNSLFTSIIVENTTRMSKRRIQETLGLRYEDLAKLSAIIADIETMVRAHPGIDTEERIVVSLNSMAESSLNITVIAFTRCTDLTEFHQVKQDVLFQIATIVARHGADFAFPTRTLHHITKSGD
ncbi:MAG: mechanosensitive ion channel family protein [Gallionella sp.]